MTAQAKITSSGRLSIPADIRKRHGLSVGGIVVIDDTGEAIVIRSVAAGIARAQEISRRLLAGKPNVSVDDFIAERRKQALAE